MQGVMKILSNEIVFWMAWVIIPLLVEIVPAIGSFIVLVLKKRKYRNDPPLKYYPDISLIIPVYNSSSTLEMCLESIRTGTYPTSKIDIMLVNNHTPDNSFEIYTRYQQEHPELNMTWLNAQQGKSKALNMALFNSEGKYIVHIDSDGRFHEQALEQLIRRFEAHEEIHCMTGSVLTDPELIKKTKGFGKRILQNVEFYEYAQAFLAGRNFQSEINGIFTLSGAFSAFRKSTILKTQLYNTETLCEDAHVTMQVRYNLHKKIDICEKALFYVDPIERLGQLYVQRQRWQRGELEVIHMFPQKKKRLFGFITNFKTRAMLFDHTFAFPRMIWYFALLCLAFMNYPFSYIAISVGVIYILYVLSAFLYYCNICSYIRWDRELLKFYAKRILYIFVLPLFNFIMYWFRFAGIINSIEGVSSWRTKSFAQEKEACKEVIRNDFKAFTGLLKKIKSKIYVE
ncbi:MAG: TIGR03111 family XrtG-associated glycosyltransferase [Lachnospiraceae bacterium]